MGYAIEIESTTGEDGGWFARGHHDPLVFMSALYEYDDLAAEWWDYSDFSIERTVVEEPDGCCYTIIHGEACPINVPGLVWRGHWRAVYDFGERQVFYHQAMPGRGAFPVTFLRSGDVASAAIRALTQETPVEWGIQ